MKATFVQFIFIVFLLVVIPKSVFSYDKWDRKRESVSIYANIGPSFPLGSHAENTGYKTGYQIGCGVGFVVQSGTSGSLGLNLRVNYYEFNQSNSRETSWYAVVTSESEDTDLAVSIEGLYKFGSHSKMKTYLLFGFGYYSNEPLFTTGFGLDRIVRFNEISGIYIELRFVASFIHQIRMDAGMRFGL